MSTNTPSQDELTLAAINRRRFFATGASGLGTLALASLLNEEGALAGEVPPQLAHFAPKAKRCIYLFMEGGPSQMDLFDQKPKLNELDGQPMPESLLEEEIKFAFIQKESARLNGQPANLSPLRRVRHGTVRLAASPQYAVWMTSPSSVRCTATSSIICRAN